MYRKAYSNVQTPDSITSLNWQNNHPELFKPLCQKHKATFFGGSVEGVLDVAEQV